MNYKIVRWLLSGCLAVSVLHFNYRAAAQQTPAADQTSSAEAEFAAALAGAATDAERQTLLESRKALHTVELRKALLALADNKSRQGQTLQAIEIARFAESFAARINDSAGRAFALRSLGFYHIDVSDYETAVAFLNQSLPLFDLMEEKFHKGSAVNAIGRAQMLSGDYQNALQSYTRAIQIIEAAKRPDLLAPPYGNTGILYRLQGDYEQSVAFYQKALKIAEATNRQNLVGNYLKSMAISRAMQRRFDEALSLAERSLEVARKLEDKRDIAASLNTIGNIHALRGDYQKALDFYRQNLAIAEQLDDKWAANKTYDSIAATLILLNQPNESLPFADRSIEFYRRIGDPDALWNALETKGRALMLLNRPEDARQVFEEAVNVLERLRATVPASASGQGLFFTDKLASYHYLSGLYLGANDVGKAFEYAERANARALIDVLQSGRAGVGDDLTADEKTREKNLTQRLVALNRQLAGEQSAKSPDAARVRTLEDETRQVRLEREAFRNSLYAARPSLRVKRGEAKIIRPEELAEIIPGVETAILKFVAAENETLIFAAELDRATKKPVLKFFRAKIKAADLNRKVADYRAQLGNRDFEFRAAARELYDLLLKPAAAVLDGKQTLVVVPDGGLWELPFQTLQDAAGKYLIESAAISYAPSLTALREMRRARVARAERKNMPPARLLAFGNPTVKAARDGQAALLSDALQPLPETETQVKVLRDLYGAPNSRVYTGAAAAETVAKREASSARLVQFAAHGVLDDQNPLYSYLVLSADEKEDGRLEAREMMDLNLQSDLVVLSACETARGRVSAGEGVIGMSWALFVAGSPATVVSQWKVDAASTTDLMLDFHRNLQNPPKNESANFQTARALRRAALKLMKSPAHRHPFYWAGFVLIGDAK